MADAIKLLEAAYGWLENHAFNATWATAGHFTLADCAAAPALFYADWVHPIGVKYPGVRAYRARLLAHPAVARTVEEARPYPDFMRERASARPPLASSWVPAMASPKRGMLA